MHRLIAFAVLLFWATLFGGIAHMSLSGMLNGDAADSYSLQLLAASVAGFNVTPIMLLLIVALFGWAILALLASDHQSFREIEAYSYAAAIFMMSACSVLGFVKLGIVASLPAILTAALVTSVAASHHLIVAEKPLVKTSNGRTIARQMALGAAHNSLLSRVSGRPLPGHIRHNSARQNVTAFPVKPTNGGII